MSTGSVFSRAVPRGGVIDYASWRCSLYFDLLDIRTLLVSNADGAKLSLAVVDAISTYICRDIGLRVSSE
jgi:hypothetical protein